jgi:hypothetical protein
LAASVLDPSPGNGLPGRPDSRSSFSSKLITGCNDRDPVHPPFHVHVPGDPISEEQGILL